MTTSTSLHLAYGLVALSLLLTSTGCIWRTAEVDHIWGPTLVRMNQPPQGKAYLWQTQSIFPLVVEGGEHIGLTLGFLKRVAANPLESNKSTPIEWCNGLFTPSCSTPTALDGWQWSLLHSRVVHHLSPEFYDRTILGASAGTGTDNAYVTLGYSANTQHRPQDNAYYILCYGRKNPLQTRFTITRDASEFISFLNQEACQ